MKVEELEKLAGSIGLIIKIQVEKYVTRLYFLFEITIKSVLFCSYLKCKRFLQGISIRIP